MLNNLTDCSTLRSHIFVYCSAFQNFYIEETELLSHIEVFEHVVLEFGLQSEAKDGNMEDSLAHLTALKLFNRVKGVVAMQVVHALEGDTLHGLFREVVEAFGQESVVGDVLEGPKEVLLAFQERIYVSSIHITYRNTGLGITRSSH